MKLTKYLCVDSLTKIMLIDFETTLWITCCQSLSVWVLVLVAHHTEVGFGDAQGKLCS